MDKKATKKTTPKKEVKLKPAAKVTKKRPSPSKTDRNGEAKKVAESAKKASKPAKKAAGGEPAATATNQVAKAGMAGAGKKGKNFETNQQQTTGETMSTNNAGPGMKTVKLVVRPPELGILAITPMASGGKKRATKVGLTHYIYFGGGVRKSGGELDFRFLVTVEDGDKKQAFEQNGDQIPCVYLSSVGDVSEFETEQAVLEAWRSEEWDTGIHSEEEIAPAWKFLQAMKQSGDGLFRYYSDYILQKAAQLMQQPGADAIQVACGSAKGKDIPFHVSIPENEDFDIRKLHFLWDDDWYDCEYDFLNECGYIFELLPVLLTMVEYDGRIYPIDSGVAFRTWHPMESKLLDANLEEIQ